MRKVWSQGNVTIKAITEDDLPYEASMKKLKAQPITSLSLQGERHQHSISGRLMSIERGWGRARTEASYLLLDKPTAIEHVQHGKMNLDAGLFEVTRQRKWTGRGGMGMGGD